MTALLVPDDSTNDASASACSESLAIVRMNKPLSGNESRARAVAVGLHVRTPASTAVPSVASVLVEEVGPMIASTPSSMSSNTASEAVASLSPSSRSITRTGIPRTPPAVLISLTASARASLIDDPSSAAAPLRGTIAPINNSPSSDRTVVVEVAVVSPTEAGGALSLHALSRPAIVKVALVSLRNRIFV